MAPGRGTKNNLGANHLPLLETSGETLLIPLSKKPEPEHGAFLWVTHFEARGGGYF